MEYSALDKQLIKNLLGVSKNLEFINHVFDILKTDMQKEKMINFIENSPKATRTDVLARMLELTIKN